MKEIKTERTYTTYDVTYEAIDGTIFDNQSECEQYEKTAKCVISDKYNKLVIKKSTEYAVFSAGSDDDAVDIVKLNNQEDIDTVMQMCYAVHNRWLSNPDESSKNYAEKFLNDCQQAYSEDDLLLIHRGYDKETFWVNRRNEYIQRLKDLCKEE